MDRGLFQVRLVLGWVWCLPQHLLKCCGEISRDPKRMLEINPKSQLKLTCKSRGSPEAAGKGILPFITTASCVVCIRTCERIRWGFSCILF